MKMNIGSKTLYKGTHYHCDKDNHLKLENVQLKLQRNGKKEYAIHVGSQMRNFEEDEFCFFELEEVELQTVEEKSKKPFICIRPKTTEEECKNFICLTIVIYKVGDGNTSCMFLGSNRIKLFDKVVFGKTSKLKELKEKLYKHFGDSVNQWFMYNVEDNNNEQPVRVVLRKTNFSVLDDKFNVLHFHRLRNLEFKECLVNPLQRLIDMKIVENSSCLSSQRVHSIKLRSSMNGEDIGYSFRTDLCNQLHEIHQNELYNVEMSPSADSRVIDWVRHLHSPSEGTENTDCLSEPSEFQHDIISYQEVDYENVNSLQPKSCSVKSDQTLSVPSVIPNPCQIKPPTPHLNLGRQQPCEDTLDLETPQCKMVNFDHVNQQESALPDNPPCCSMKPPSGHLMRAESVIDLYVRKRQRINSYNDTVDESKRISVTSSVDSEYQKIYYKNQGWIKCCRSKVLMSKRIQRHRHINFNISNVDFETVNKHEQWWDNNFKIRDEDDRFMRTVPAMKICNRTPQQSSDPEDIYWNSDLCLTVQLMMERKSPKISDDLDLSWSQLLAVFIHLSLDQQPACLRKDWRDFAEMLGLRCRDIEIIQHFCYTQREWTGRVILCHWKLLVTKGRNVPQFNFYNLRKLLLELGRNDILKIIDYSETNCFEQIDECTSF